MSSFGESSNIDRSNFDTTSIDNTLTNTISDGQIGINTNLSNDQGKVSQEKIMELKNLILNKFEHINMLPLIFHLPTQRRRFRQICIL